jgi:two-component system, OmpR family, response regulator
MPSLSFPTALLCTSNHQDHARIEHLLTAGGFHLLPNTPIGRVFTYMESQNLQPSILVAYADDGGITLAGMLHALMEGEAEANRLPVLLFDRTDSAPLARAALRSRPADYLRLTLPDERLIERIALLASSCNQTEQMQVAVASSTSDAATLKWDASIAAVYSDGAWLQLSPIEWRLFEMLLQHRGEAVTNADLIHGPLGRTEESQTTSSLLRLHMSRMRAKIEEHGVRGLSIVTVRGHGYMLI